MLSMRTHAPIGSAVNIYIDIMSIIGTMDEAAESGSGLQVRP